MVHISIEKVELNERDLISNYLSTHRISAIEIKCIEYMMSFAVLSKQM